MKTVVYRSFIDICVTKLVAQWGPIFCLIVNNDSQSPKQQTLQGFKNNRPITYTTLTLNNE